VCGTYIRMRHTERAAHEIQIKYYACEGEEVGGEHVCGDNEGYVRDEMHTQPPALVASSRI
jgi:hypothetical protein